MAIYFHTKGRPISVREIKMENEYVFCIDFKEESKTSPPKGLPKPNAITSTALLNTKQFKKLEKTIISNNNTVETMNQLFIKGEIITGLPGNVSENDIIFIAFEAQYLPYKEDQNVEDNGVKVKTEFLRSNRETIHNSNSDVGIPQIVIDLHQKFDGVCQKCGQRCDKKTMHVPEDNKNTILCIDCFKAFPKLVFEVGEELLEKFVTETGMNKKDAEQYITQFPSKYAFVDYNPRYKTRHYWSWDNRTRIRELFTDIDGEIVRVVLKDKTHIQVKKKKKKHIRFSVFHDDKSKKQITVRVGKRKFEKIRDDEMFLLEIAAPKSMRDSKPNPQKIEDKMNYYKENNSFPKPVVLLEKQNTLFLIDEYTSYIAAKKMNLDKIDVVIVKERSFKPSRKKGGKKRAIQNKNNRNSLESAK